MLHVITRLILGGAQENTLFNCQDLVEQFGDDVLLVTGPTEGPEGSLVERARSAGVPLEVVDVLKRSIDPVADARSYRRLRAIIERFRPDVVHTHSSKAGILGRAAAWNARVPAVVHTIHGLPFHPNEVWWRNALYVRLERWSARRCHRIISVADAMTEQALAVGIGRQDQFLTIPSGMDVEPFLTSDRLRDEVRRSLGLREDQIAVMKVARLFEHKGHDDVIAAAAQVHAQMPNARFIFVGGGQWRDRLAQAVDAIGMSEAFHFTGIVPPEQIPGLLAASDLVVHASYREGLARVLPQALISGRPVISYDVDGAREVCLPGRTGILVRPGDIQGLARAMLELAADPEKRSSFGQTGRALFADVFRHDEMTRKIRALYGNILARR